MTLNEPMDPSRCPLCGGPNGCAMACAGPDKSAGPCWCTRVPFSERLLQQVPEAARHRACICLACVLADQADA